MRYYEARYPEVDELVMVQVRQIAEMGAYVKLVRPSKTHPVYERYNIYIIYSSSMTTSRA
jgi:hypothetical protein